MSDAKAKAEARRAKILGRNTDRLALAKGNLASLNDEADDSEVVRPERPLAHRRHLIEKGDDGSQGETPEKELYTPFKDTDTTEPGDETPRLDDDDTPSQMLSAKTPATEKRVESLLTPQVVRDIEKEIAQHTQEFDRSMLDKSNSKGELSSKVTYSSTKTPNEKSGSETAVSAEVKLKAKKLNLSAPIQATHVIQLIRLLAIITIAAISGYYAVIQHGSSVPSTAFTRDSIFSGNDDAQRTDKLDQFLQASVSNTASYSEEGLMYGTESAGGGGVLGWVSRRLTAQLGSTVSAVGLVWWVTSMLSTAVHRMFPNKAKASGGIMNTLLALYSDGLQMIIEYILKIAGEMCVHFIIVIGTSLAIAYYLENLQDATSVSSVTDIINTPFTEMSSVISTEDTVVDTIVTMIANITEQGVESEL